MALIAYILRRRRFRLPDFEPGVLDFDELAELMLQEPAELSEGSNVVALHRPAPTAGELRQSIERHLQAKDDGKASVDAVSPAEELRNALAELRQSLR